MHFQAKSLYIPNICCNFAPSLGAYGKEIIVPMAKKNEIAKVESASIQPLENIENLIHVIRGKQVMLDRDLARLYGVETFRLNEQVKRNIERFPEDFMFQLTKEEFENWKSQFAISIPNENMSSQFVTTSKDTTNMSSQFVTTSAKRSSLKIIGSINQLPSPRAIPLLSPS